jgi:hypothetical protein
VSGPTTERYVVTPAKSNKMRTQRILTKSRAHLELLQECRGSRKGKNMLKRIAVVYEKARWVTTEAEYRAWYNEHWEPVSKRLTKVQVELGMCITFGIPDEGLDLHNLMNTISSEVHQKGWRV